MGRSQKRKRADDLASKSTSRGWTARRKRVLSLAIAVHLLAVVAEPFKFFTQGASAAAEPVRSLLAPYVEMAYLNHGYFFFAPNPGPSHLMECRLTLADGKRSRLRFPDRDALWPRLLYHRHFMLSEFLHQLHAPPLAADVAESDEQLVRDWQANRSRYEAVRDSMTRHLVARYGASTAEIDRVEHRLPDAEEVLLRRLRLNDPALYITLPDAPIESAFSPADVPASLVTPSFPMTEPQSASALDDGAEEVQP